MNDLIQDILPELKKLRDQGLSYEKIGKKHGISRHKIFYIFNPTWNMDFQRKRTKEGLCAVCGKIAVIVGYCEFHRQKRHELTKKQYRKNLTKKREAGRLYSQRPEVKLNILKKAKEAYLKHPEKAIARAKLRNAVKSGKIDKPELCDHLNRANLICTGRMEAHHYLGYEGEHWKDVMWLCRGHHGVAHGRYIVL